MSFRSTLRSGFAFEIRILLYLLMFGILIRVVYALEYSELPFFDAPLFDSVVYLRQAEAVRSRDFGHATLLAFSPLYGFFLAFFGSWVYAAQAFMGLMSALILGHVASKSFGASSGLATVALVYGYGLLMFYETKLMSETLGFFLLSIAFAMYVGLSDKAKGAKSGVGAGILFALATLTRSNLLLSLPFLVVCSLFAWSHQESARVRVRRTCSLALGLGLVLMAWGTWNWSHTGFFVPVTLVPRTLERTAAEPWDGDLRSAGIAGNRVSAWDIVKQADDVLAHRIQNESIEIDLTGLLQGIPQKLWRTFRNTETTFQYGYYGERTEVRALTLTSISFGFLLLLALLGACVESRQERRLLLRYLPLLLGAVATCLVAHPSSRYRLPMLVPMVVLAGRGVIAIASLRSNKHSGRGLRLGCVLLFAFTITAYLVTGSYELRHPGMWELRVAEGEIGRGDIKAAASRIKRARELEPESALIQSRIDYLKQMRKPE
ncbi:MAG: hypothetical protein AAF550_02560 [Myxococcota bacterium]